MRRPILSLALALALATAAAAAEEVVVFAAASLKTALDQIATDFQAATGNTVVISYAGSNTLAQQIIQGAPADIFVSANEKWMDEVAKANLIAEGTRADLLGNTLVLIAHGKAAAPVEIGPGFDLAALLGDEKLAMAMVDSVPAGQYGKAALETLGIWAAVEPNVAVSSCVARLGDAPEDLLVALLASETRLLMRWKPRRRAGFIFERRPHDLLHPVRQAPAQM